MLVLLGALQVAVVGAHQLALETAAREGARAAAVSASPQAAGRQAAHQATNLDGLTVSVAVSGSTVTVTVRFTDPTDVPLAGALIGNVSLSASATMQLEPPG